MMKNQSIQQYNQENKKLKSNLITKCIQKYKQERRIHKKGINYSLINDQKSFILIQRRQQRQLKKLAFELEKIKKVIELLSSIKIIFLMMMTVQIFRIQKSLDWMNQKQQNNNQETFIKRYVWEMHVQTLVNHIKFKIPKFFFLNNRAKQK
ncbi:unnamed protein product [Paramecium sonneborni]|uniref:Transmembrane protein n=1 Tax=Paramecium sonneborni TaxID=65129 RepID=A0A8S1MRA6_9CILI|nr:unnamed protein product [Paramecium sonneborni]